MPALFRDFLLATSVIGGWITTQAVILPACGIQSCTGGSCIPVPGPTRGQTALQTPSRSASTASAAQNHCPVSQTFADSAATSALHHESE